MTPMPKHLICLLGRRQSTLLLVSLVASLLFFSPVAPVDSFSVAPRSRAEGKAGATSLGAAMPNTDEESVKLKTTSDERKTPYYHDVALRFSPLVGGPTFLPLHVSVLMTATTKTHIVATSPSGHTPSVSRAVVGAASEGGRVDGRVATMSSSPPPSEPPSDICQQRRRQHQFDFLPLNAQDPDVLRRLVMLREVPGLVRCRTETMAAGRKRQESPQPVSGTCDDEVVGAHGTDGAGEEGTGTKREIRTKKGGAATTFMIPMGTTELPVESAEEFCASYRRDGGSSLHLLSNNCLTFAVRLVAHLEPRLF